MQTGQTNSLQKGKLLNWPFGRKTSTSKLAGYKYDLMKSFAT